MFGPPTSTLDRVMCGCWGGGEEGLFFSLREVFVLSFRLLPCLEPCKKILVWGGGGWWIHSEFSVLFWFKALVLDLRPGPS